MELGFFVSKWSIGIKKIILGECYSGNNGHLERGLKSKMAAAAKGKKITFVKYQSGIHCWKAYLILIFF